MRVSWLLIGAWTTAAMWLAAPEKAFSQISRREPYVGYVYPAGACQGNSVSVILGGQNLRGARIMHISGYGIQGRITDYAPALNRKQLQDVGQHLRYWMRVRWAEIMAPNYLPRLRESATQKKEELPRLPDHPWLRGLEKMSLKELDALRRKLFDPKKQPNAQLGEMIFATLSIAQKAAPGVYEIRLETPTGITNPVHFIVGTMPEIIEQEPNTVAPASAAELPVVFNGQIMPGDVDSFRFKARQGQKLVFTAEARQLVPYMADAVPGWMQAVLTLYDSQGKELAYADDYRFDPDPVLFFSVPQDGEYVIQIRDSLYRGREDFVYRITAAEQPFVTSFFPLGGQAGQPLQITLYGWNLPEKTAYLDTKPEGPRIRPTQFPWPQERSHPLCYAVDTLPEINETEPNNGFSVAQKVSLPQIINGCINFPGDVDAFSFEGNAGQEIVAEIMARRLGSPLDSLLELLDSEGRLLARNDDYADRSFGLLTHHADSYIYFQLPRKGRYAVLVRDMQQQGGVEFAYRLRLSAPQPDFALYVTPSSLKMSPGACLPLTVHAIRKDGFTGEIALSLAAPSQGFSLQGARIPPGQETVHFTIRAPFQPIGAPLTVRLEGKAQIGEKIVTHLVQPAEEMMQAFAYRHLVPAQQLLAIVNFMPGMPPGIAQMELISSRPIRIPLGGTQEAIFKAPPPGLASLFQNVKLELHSAPEGVSLKEQAFTPAGVKVALSADKAKLKPGWQDNLIFEAFGQGEIKRPNGKTMKWQRSLGFLPAVPMEIVP